MVRLTVFAVLGVFVYLVGDQVALSQLPAATSQSKRQQDLQKQFEKEVLPILREACFDCHGPQEANEGIALHKYPDVESVTSDRKVWERILRALRFGKMPPQGSPALSQEKRKLLVDWIRPVVTEINCDLPRPLTPVTIRRLNRSEYDNTIRDLLGLDIHPARDFPSDDVGEGFDNIGDVLSLPPLLFEKYLDAAEAIASAVPGCSGGDCLRRNCDRGPCFGSAPTAGQETSEV